MNLAEIRKKAARGESAGSAARGESAPPWAPSPTPVEELGRLATDEEAPEFPSAGFLPEEFPAPELCDALTVQDLPQVLWQAGPTAQFPDPLAAEEEPEGFDPVAVILRGRESASFEVESQQDEAAAASVELLCFRVADEEYAISIMDIKEIIKPREVTEVPRVPAFVRGILSLRGNIIPIFDMRVRLGLAGGEGSERERVVVVKRDNGFAGVLVDEVVQVVRIPEGEVEPPPVVLEGIDREFVLGIGRVAGRMLILLDMDKVLDVGLL